MDKHSVLHILFIFDKYNVGGGWDHECGRFWDIDEAEQALFNHEDVMEYPRSAQIVSINLDTLQAVWTVYERPKREWVRYGSAN